jgi:mannose-6-phosphate isomerase-like protein (cupin superfamily)
MTLYQLAERSGLTKSFVSKIERGLSVPSISTAMKLAESFLMTVGQLLGEEQYDDAVCVVRKGQRRRFMRAGSSSGYNYEMIAAGKRFRTMEPFVMYPPTEFHHNRMFQHPGQELIFVLSGTVEVQFADRHVLLNKDDSVYFDAHVPHRSRSVGKAPAQALVVVTLDRASPGPV